MDQQMMVKRIRTVKEAVSEVHRELNVRRRCFPKWIEQGKCDETDAQDRLDRLYTALTVLKTVELDETLLQFCERTLTDRSALDKQEQAQAA